jgi:hypothetical protein
MAGAAVWAFGWFNPSQIQILPNLAKSAERKAKESLDFLWDHRARHED